MGGDLIHRSSAEIEPLAPGQDGIEDFLGFRSRQDEYHMFRRLFQGLQQGIERIGGDYMT